MYSVIKYQGLGPLIITLISASLLLIKVMTADLDGILPRIVADFF
jgi:hypothetical protein